MGNLDLVELALEGAEVGKKDKFGREAVWWAAQGSSEEQQNLFMARDQNNERSFAELTKKLSLGDENPDDVAQAAAHREGRVNRYRTVIRRQRP